MISASMLSNVAGLVFLTWAVGWLWRDGVADRYRTRGREPDGQEAGTVVVPTGTSVLIFNQDKEAAMNDVTIEFGRYKVTAERRNYTVNRQDPTAVVEWKGELVRGPHVLPFKMSCVWDTVEGELGDQHIMPFNLVHPVEYPSDAEALWHLLEETYDAAETMDRAFTTEEERVQQAMILHAETLAGWDREP